MTRVVLFLLAHHDDEVFCAGHLLAARRAGDEVRVLWATAGGLAPARRRLAEGRHVRALLGLAPERSRDLFLRDRAAIDHLDVVARQAAAMLPPGDDAAVLVPSYEGGHPDHDAMNAAAAAVRRLRPSLAISEFPMYRRGRGGLVVQSPEPPAQTPPEPFDVLTLDEEALALRRELARANASQLAPSLLPLLALARGAGRGRAEPARPLPAHDYSRPPHAGRLLYEVYTRRRFPEFRAAALALAAQP